MLFLTLGADSYLSSRSSSIAGAIVILFLCVIMLLGVDRSEISPEPRRFQTRQLAIGGRRPHRSVVACSLAAALSTRTLSARFPSALKGSAPLSSIGGVPLSELLASFELTGRSLLVATIGILMLAKRKPR